MRKLPTEENKKLDKWKSRLEKARMAYESQLSCMKSWQELYDGTKRITKPKDTTEYAKKDANNVRNVVYELIESQVDSSVPMPKVTAVHEEDTELARSIEHLLANYIKVLHLSRLNDTQERITPVLGGDFTHVEWDVSKGYHTTLGDLSVSERSPLQIIPQPGVIDIEKMDYLFVQMPQTRNYVKSRYGVEVEDAEEERPDLRDADKTTDTDNVTVNIAYYRNKKGGIGTFVWCDDYVLEELEDYQARQIEVCVKCGKTKDGDKCECGSTKFKRVSQDYEDMVDSITISTGQTIDPETQTEVPMVDENGLPMVDEMGNPMVEMRMEKKKIPFYKPNCYPIICRKNVSRPRSLLGVSDVEVIRDQQESIKKYGSRILEESLKGGSIVTLPEDMQIETTDELLKVARVRNPQDKALIDVISLTPSVQQDLAMLENNYQWAKSTLGITDAYQGKYDSSATSGTAKQYSINQAAGRLESKRVMKNDAWAQLYELMFKYLLAYADNKVPVTFKAEDGEQKYEYFDRYKFLRVDDAGEMYWNDEFIFETDPTSTMMMNREAMWNSIDVKYQAGAYGPIGETRTLLLLWKQLEANNYPNAAIVRADLEKRYADERSMQNEMPIMPGGDEIVQPTL